MEPAEVFLVNVQVEVGRRELGGGVPEFEFVMGGLVRAVRRGGRRTWPCRTHPATEYQYVPARYAFVSMQSQAARMLSRWRLSLTLAKFQPGSVISNGVVSPREACLARTWDALSVIQDGLRCKPWASAR